MSDKDTYIKLLEHRLHILEARYRNYDCEIAQARTQRDAALHDYDELKGAIEAEGYEVVEHEAAAGAGGRLDAARHATGYLRNGSRR